MRNTLRKLSRLELGLVTIARGLTKLGGIRDYQGEIPLPLTGGKRLEYRVDSGELLSISFLQSKGTAIDQWDEKFILTEPSPGPWGMAHELSGLDEDPVAIVPITAETAEAPESPKDPAIELKAWAAELEKMQKGLGWKIQERIKAEIKLLRWPLGGLLAGGAAYAASFGLGTFGLASAEAISTLGAVAALVAFPSAIFLVATRVAGYNLQIPENSPAVWKKIRNDRNSPSPIIREAAQYAVREMAVYQDKTAEVHTKLDKAIRMGVANAQESRGNYLSDMGYAMAVDDSTKLFNQANPNIWPKYRSPLELIQEFVEEVNPALTLTSEELAAAMANVAQTVGDPTPNKTMQDTEQTQEAKNLAELRAWADHLRKLQNRIGWKLWARYSSFWTVIDNPQILREMENARRSPNPLIQEAALKITELKAGDRYTSPIAELAEVELARKELEQKSQPPTAETQVPEQIKKDITDLPTPTTGEEIMKGLADLPLPDGMTSWFKEDAARRELEERLSKLSHGQLDSHVHGELLERPASKAHAQEFLAVAKRLCEVHDTGSWNHSVCHFIEKYREGGNNSLLNYLDTGFPQYQEALDMLVEKAFAAENCISRILGPILRYNLDKELSTGHRESFACRPLAFTPSGNHAKAREWFKKTDYSDSRGIALMIRSSSPAELWDLAEKEGVPLYYDIKDYRKAPMPPERLAKYLDAAYGADLAKKTGGLSGQDIAGNLQIKAAGQIKKGIYVDVDDTLIRGEKLNDGLVQALVAAKKAGIKVQIISAGNPESQTQRLLELGLPKNLGTVSPKAALKGSTLEMLVDDTSPALNGFGAKTWKEPGVWGVSEAIDKFISQNGGMSMAGS
jgi:hypothetical protein